MIPFAAIDRATVESHFADFNTNDGSHPYNHLLLGKMVIWSEQFHTTGTLKKYIRREFATELASQTYRCAKLFRAIHSHELPGVSEQTYDTLALNDALRVTPLLGHVPNDQIATSLLNGIDGRSRYRRRSKDPSFPRAGHVYILVSSSHPMLTKIGRTQLDPYTRAAALSRQTGSTSTLVVVWHERVSDCVAVETTMHQWYASRKHNQGGDEWFAVTPKEAIPVLMRLAEQYAMPTNA